MSENELNEIREIRKKILDLIGQAQTETAISLLKEFLEAKNPSLYSKLVLISNRFHELKQKQTLGLSFEDSHLNDLNYDFIKFVNSLETKLSKTENLDSKLLSRNAIGVIGVSLMGIIVMCLYLNNSTLNNERNISIRPEPLVSKASNKEFTPRAVWDESKPKKERIEPIDSIIIPDDKKDLIRLVFHFRELHRYDTFSINTDWTIRELKKEIVHHFKIDGRSPIMKINNRIINADKGEAITLNELMYKKKLKEFDVLNIYPGNEESASNEESPFNKSIDIDAQDWIAYNPPPQIPGDNLQVPTNGQMQEGINWKKDNYTVENCAANFGLNKNQNTPQLRQSNDDNKRKEKKKYIISSKFGIVEENEIFIIREPDEDEKYTDEEE